MKKLHAVVLVFCVSLFLAPIASAQTATTINVNSEATLSSAFSSLNTGDYIINLTAPITLSGSTAWDVPSGCNVKIQASGTNFLSINTNDVLTKTGPGTLVFDTPGLNFASGNNVFTAGAGTTSIQGVASIPIDRLDVGNLPQEHGTMQIVSGGKATVSTGVVIAEAANSKGTLIVSGTGSTLTINGQLSGPPVPLGTGSIIVSDNGKIVLNDPAIINPSLVFNGGTATFSSGGTLTGKGIINGNNTSQVVFESGGILSPTDTTAPLSILAANLIMKPASVFNPLVVNVGGTADIARVELSTGDAAIDGAFLSLNPVVDTNGNLLSFTGKEILGINGGSLTGEFTLTHNPYMRYTPTYSGNNVTLDGTPLSAVDPLSDLKAMSLMMPEVNQRRMVFRQIRFDEPQGYADIARNSKRNSFGSDGVMLGQSGTRCSNTCDWGMWFEGIGRWSEFDSNFIGFADPHRLESFGMVLGFGQVIAPRTVFGAMGGYEHPRLWNRGSSISADEIRADDAFFGIYGGHQFLNKIELKSWIGGGFQSYTSQRYEAPDYYTGKFKGESFSMSFEVSRPFTNAWTVLRPVLAFDFYSVHQRPFEETNTLDIQASANYGKNYTSSSLSQAFARFGGNFETRCEEFKLTGAIYYSHLLNDDTVPEVGFTYQDTIVGGSGVMSGSNLGRSALSGECGFRWAPACYSGKHTFYVDYAGDLYMDREDSPAQHTITLGYVQRI